ncbi:DEAD/DEAH box helicase family protein [Gemmiger formicilis]|uniref:DEAD/DEAH box helicase family protein n=1 Tax=Gemmiger formicilis TaxID=745368 RepID=UPI00210A8F43|nr:DEAD/DEAH box helicase family protein [Gemmiger formicilis]MCQ5078312.1 DEAD/DEAH box helicase family protein [Gemmiger formicilis]MCQ5115253.1 DEAD/DEAH box helicase family protein [Gemmiger formicilis]
MPFLYEQLDTLREFGSYTEIPPYIQENVNQRFELRPYQIGAFENFITYFENEKMCRKPTQTLFHMATGSGKTMIMAGLMLYLYKKGYRNFLFFVNLSNIVNKTRENFLNALSSKYLFADEIRLNGERVQIKEVSNFQYSDDDAINICFTTTQGLHSDMWTAKENALSDDDFANKKVVFISDEAHHLNVDTKALAKNKDEQDNYKSWEYTVRRIFEMNKDNVLLEFTATCDIHNPQIRAEYESKIVYDYPLSKFRADGYSKEIKTLRSDVSVMERAIQAIMLSQYRLKVFQDNRLSVKPVVLFKAAKIADSNAFMEDFIDTVKNLTGDELRRVSELTDNETLGEAYAYFEKNGISFEQLAQELRDDFSAEHCISANDDKEAAARQIALNSLEDATNPYRAVFEVKKLDEGWDVLNLFDIVRLYETRQSSGKRISPATISEAQLIGRGARYCPFQIDDEQEKYKRKYDTDIDNPLRICEELYYHCQNDSRYIGELNNALREIGVDIENKTVRTYVLKDTFKADSLYREGFVFTNDRVEKSRNDVDGLLPSVREHIYAVKLSTGSSGEDTIFGAGNALTEKAVATYTYRTDIQTIADMNYAIVHKALCKYSVFKFNTLKSYFPNLKSTREFITSPNYLGAIKIEITSKYETPTPSILFSACVNVLGKVAESVSDIEITYVGTTEFKPTRISEMFKDKKCNYTIVHDGGLGYSQNDASVPNGWKIDLSKEDWFAFEDNFGTSEEKAFVAYFKSFIPHLKEKYDKVFLVRNERQLHIYSFDGGERFEPDYLLFLHKQNDAGYEQLQVFIEPKGTHLIADDKWKEDFLLEIEDKAVTTKIFVDDNKYKIWGFHFFNTDVRMNEFKKDMERL